MIPACLKNLWQKIFQYKKTNPLYFWIFSFILLIIFFVFLQRAVLLVENTIYHFKYTKKLASQSQKNQEAYQKLLNQPTKQSKSDHEEQTKLNALGKHNLFVVFVYPETTSITHISPLVNSLKGNNHYSLNYVKEFIAGEAKKYGVTDLELNLIPKGPFLLKNLSRIGDFSNPWGKDYFALSGLEDQFSQILKQNEINYAEKDLVVFLYFDDSLHQDANTQKSSLYDYKKFRSFANQNKLRAYLNIYDFSSSFAPKLIETIIHETLHLFGATDKYIEASSTGACSSKGRGNPDQVPLFPQKTADIMCFFVEESEGKFYRARITDNNLVINAATAQEIGWTN